MPDKLRAEIKIHLCSGPAIFSLFQRRTQLEHYITKQITEVAAEVNRPGLAGDHAGRMEAWKKSNRISP